MAWNIERIRIVDRTGVDEGEVALALDLLGSRGRTCQVTIEQMQGAPAVTAFEAVARYLEWSTPPRRLLVHREGNVTVAHD